MNFKIMEKQTLQSTLKSADTEEWIDIVFYRPIGYQMALWARTLHITPNQITVTSMFIGIAAGILFYYELLWVNVIGMLLLILANSMDSADGQLARMTNKCTQFGRVLDGFCGDLWFISINFMLAFRLMNEGYSIYTWIFLFLNGYLHTKQASLADYYRNFHLLIINKNKEFVQSKVQKEKYKILSWRKDFLNTFSVYMYGNYTFAQEKSTPHLQQFYNLLRIKYVDNIPQKLTDEFRLVSKPLMKYCNILTFNTRVIALFVALFLGMPILYFIFEFTVLNAILLYLWLKHERISEHFYSKLFRNEF